MTHFKKEDDIVLLPSMSTSYLCVLTTHLSAQTLTSEIAFSKRVITSPFLPHSTSF